MSPTRKFQGRKLEFNGCAVCTVQAVGPEGHPAGPGLWGALLREDNPGRSAGVWSMLDLRAPSPHLCLHQLSEQKPPAPGCAGQQQPGRPALSADNTLPLPSGDVPGSFRAELHGASLTSAGGPGCPHEACPVRLGTIYTNRRWFPRELCEARAGSRSHAQPSPAPSSQQELTQVSWDAKLKP